MSALLHIIADSNIWGAKSAFSSLGDIRLLAASDITAPQVRQCDILLIRSGVRAQADLLEGSSVRFVGTATIGDDHVDKLYLQSQAITFASAAGSSTQSVAEYMLAVFFTLENMGKLSFSKDKLGIIGVGRIGSLLHQACGQLGLEVLLNDPPRGLSHSLDAVLENADILTLHTPLTHDGEHPTYHLLGEKEFAKFKGKGLINAGRGACVDNIALLNWLNKDKEHFAVLDCWENEPNIYLELLKHPQTVIATPHIAGHSLDGKAMNTYFVYKDLCDFLQVPLSWDIHADLPDIQPNTLPKGLSKSDLALTMYPIQQDTQAMKQAASNHEDFAAWFASYRQHYPVRRSFAKVLEASGYDKDMFF